MADQAITALPKKTYSGSSQIASTDYLLGIDSAEGYQMLIQDLGEYIINRATASLAGSTQTLASAISALNSNKLSSMVSENTGGASYNLNDLRTQGLYYINPASQNVPTSTTWGWLVVIKRNNEVMYQQFIGTNGLEYRRHSLTATTWGDWYQLPSRAEVESAFSGYTATISGNSTLVVQNIVFMYFRFGGMMLISGRLNITNKGDGTGSLRISLPTGFKVAVGSVGSYGTITPDVNIENKVPYASMSMRGDTNADTIYVQYGAGSNSMPYLQLGYHMIFAVVPVTKTA